VGAGGKYAHNTTRRHAQRETRIDLQERGITPTFWPAFSPDLNPIETLWNIMKDYLEIHYPESDCSYDQLRAHVKEAWDSITSDQLLDLLKNYVAAGGWTY